MCDKAHYDDLCNKFDEMIRLQYEANASILLLNERAKVASDKFIATGIEQERQRKLYHDTIAPKLVEVEMLKIRQTASEESIVALTGWAERVKEKFPIMKINSEAVSRFKDWLPYAALCVIGTGFWLVMTGRLGIE